MNIKELDQILSMTINDIDARLNRIEVEMETIEDMLILEFDNAEIEDVYDLDEYIINKKIDYLNAQMTSLSYEQQSLIIKKNYLGFKEEIVDYSNISDYDCI